MKTSENVCFCIENLSKVMKEILDVIKDDLKSIEEEYDKFDVADKLIARGKIEAYKRIQNVFKKRCEDEQR